MMLFNTDASAIASSDAAGDEPIYAYIGIGLVFILVMPLECFFLTRESGLG